MTVAIVAIFGAAGSTAAAPMISWSYTDPVVLTNGECVDTPPGTTSVNSPCPCKATVDTGANATTSSEPVTLDAAACEPDPGLYAGDLAAMLSFPGFSVPYGAGGAIGGGGPGIHTAQYGSGLDFRTLFEDLPPDDPTLLAFLEDPLLGFPADNNTSNSTGALTNGLDLDQGSVDAPSQGNEGLQFNAPLQTAPVPEPSTMILFASGLVIAAKVARRKRNS